MRASVGASLRTPRVARIVSSMFDHPEVRQHLASAPYPLLFVTVSGAHLYGFESPDSDIDLRGCHIVPAREVFSLNPVRDTVEVMDKSGRVEIDLVTHDVRKFFTLWRESR